MPYLLTLLFQICQLMEIFVSKHSVIERLTSLIFITSVNQLQVDAMYTFLLLLQISLPPPTPHYSCCNCDLFAHFGNCKAIITDNFVSSRMSNQVCQFEFSDFTNVNAMAKPAVLIKHLLNSLKPPCTDCEQLHQLLTFGNCSNVL